jgi:steroid 5-alpha reductase family enzyme
MISFLDPAFLNVWYACNIIAFITWLLTLVNNNFSQVDRVWSILPVLYSWAFVAIAVLNNPGPQPDVQVISENLGEDIKSGSARPGVVLEGDNSSLTRLIVMASLITVWGCRLTYNYWRKGKMLG